MKITCLTESVSQLGGGLFDAERRMQQSVLLRDNRLEVKVIGMWDKRAEEDRQNWDPVVAETIRTAKLPPGLGYSGQFEKRLLQQSPDLVYCIGLWKYFSRSCLRWHRKTGGPYMIAPHGMLDPWAMRNHQTRKKILMRLYQGAHFANAACIRALNLAELEAIRALNFKNPVCLIPNGVDLPEITSTSTKKPDRPTILFLGRLDPKKGIEVLLESWQRFVADAGKDYLLKVVGWGDAEYVTKLQQMATTLNLDNSVQWAGPQFGQEKQKSFLEAIGFVLPSFSEGMPMTILEAWSYHLPVIMTPQCNIPEGIEHEACIECQPEVDSLTVAFEQFARMSESDKIQMGDRGRNLVERNFTWDVVSSKMAQVYGWLTEDNACPDSVVHD